MTNDHKLIEAATIGDTEEVQRLIPISDPKALDSRALRWAVHNGHAECVKLLIPVSDPKVLDSEALRWAAHNGHTECVKLLIPVSDLKVVNKLGLEISIANISQEPKNNDRRSNCFWCSTATEKRGIFGEYNLCPRCEK